jgi:UDP-glucose 4-epimerase
MKIVVFGGAGFLGSYVVSELIRRGHEVTVADLSQQTTEAVFKKCDVAIEKEVESIFTEPFDVVYNFAGFSSLDLASQFPKKVVELNVMGNINILDQIKDMPIKRFVFASSAYAMSNKGTFYGISKLTSEKIIREYAKITKLPFTILRYGSVYSEKNFSNNYIYKLIEEAVKTKKITHGGDGSELREYIHAVDAASLSCDILEDDSHNGENYIITGNSKIKRIDLFNMINEILGNKVEVKCLDNAYENHYKLTPYSFQPMICKKLTPNPHIELGQGLLRCIQEMSNE